MRYRILRNIFLLFYLYMNSLISYGVVNSSSILTLTFLAAILSAFQRLHFFLLKVHPVQCANIGGLTVLGPEAWTDMEPPSQLATMDSRIQLTKCR